MGAHHKQLVHFILSFLMSVQLYDFDQGNILKSPIVTLAGRVRLTAKVKLSERSHVPGLVRFNPI